MLALTPLPHNHPSIHSKQPPNGLHIIPRIQCQLQQNPTLLRIQKPTINLRGARRIPFRIPIHCPMRKHHRYPRRIIHLRRHGRALHGPAARADPREHDALGAELGGGADERAVRVLITVKDIDTGESGSGGEVKEGFAEGGSRRGVKLWDLVDEEAKLALFSGVEGIKAVGVVFGRKVGAANAAREGGVSVICWPAGVLRWEERVMGLTRSGQSSYHGLARSWTRRGLQLGRGSKVRRR